MNLNNTLKKYLNFIKIEHTLFTLPLIYSGFIVGMRETPSMLLVALVLLSATGARIIAFALNRIIDRRIDARNPRTLIRELPSGKMSLNEAYAVMAVGAILYFGAAYFISSFCLLISPIPLIIFIVYPYMKRFTVLAHFGVGLGMSMAPLGGYFAASPSFENIIPAVFLCLFTIFWGAGFDIIYATLDEEFDKKERLYSFVSRFGKEKALFWSSVFHVVAFGWLACLFFATIRTWYAVPFLTLSGFLLWFEQRKASDVELAFFKVNAGLGFVVFAMIVTGAIFH
ncbi:MAG: 4-hydroxybenzoate octaprenyltransferase [Bacteroidetes bacterium]|nr:MAG: 4-hydroxybenzoate octaprenyltransferase [Bacteroidota bacterium]